jgi:UDP-GlcNAc:undecaprenyl-phosphate GlcNAc-1-phosphate transferase
MAVTAAAAAFAIAVATTPIAAWLAPRVGMLDRPGPLKVHQQAVPYLGGLAVFAAIAGPVAVARPRVLVPLALALVLGLADDRFEVTPILRLGCEVVIGVAVVATVPGRLPAALGVPFVIVLVVLVINAVNLIDGLDGVAAGVALAAALGFAGILAGDDRTVALALAGATAGFLVFNRPPARIYLGDAGAYLLGTALAILVWSAWATETGRAGAPAAALLLVAVPVADTSITILRRIRAGQPLFLGDRGHVYDQLVDRGWPVVRASLAMGGGQAVLALLAVGVARLSLAQAVTAVAAAAALMLLAASVGGFLTPDYRRSES